MRPETLIWLVPALPLLAAAWIGLGYARGSNRTETGERGTARVVLLATGASLALLLLLDIRALLRGAPGPVHLGTWIASGEYRIEISFLLDGLGLGAATVVAFLCWMTFRFSINYLHRETGFQRFFLVLSLFTGGMLLLTLAGNAALSFVGWELAGVASYLLIGYAFERTTATRNANRAFITTRIGDAGFVLGIFLAFRFVGELEWPAVLEHAAQMSSLETGLLGVGFLAAAFAKSAQLPFSPWLSRALEGPTPSSAVFYGALLSHAGVFLLLRLEPVLSASPALLGLIAVVGLATAVYGHLGALTHADVKSGLLFSTMAQIGLMFLAIGLGWFQWATWHLAAHTLWRAYQFLHAPALMHYMSRPTRPVPAWLARRRLLFAAGMQRLWLDHLAHWLLVQPIRGLARDADAFDQRVVNRIVGLPAQAGAMSSLADWEQRRDGAADPAEAIGRGRGILGALMQWLATSLQWIEERLVLGGGGEGLLAVLRRVGRYLQHIEVLLSEPRYLIVIILATFAVIV